jgi:hypothetical protein
VQHHDVGRFDAVRILSDVVSPAVDTRLVDPGLAKQAARLGVVGR